ncbi:MAG: hypothetical protein JWN98_1332 [Abditibacteriota bacterium]|nr:hypothetical protein [Abditibacteriota bacterium]
MRNRSEPVACTAVGKVNIITASLTSYLGGWRRLSFTQSILKSSKFSTLSSHEDFASNDLFA